MTKTTYEYGIQYVDIARHPKGIYRHRTVYPLLFWLIEEVVKRHPDWGWWDRLWQKISPDIGEPFCYWYCVKWSPWYWRHHIERTEWGPLAWADIPEKDRTWLLTSLKKTQHEDEEDLAEPLPLIIQLQQEGVL